MPTIPPSSPGGPKAAADELERALVDAPLVEVGEARPRAAHGGTPVTAEVAHVLETLLSQTPPLLHPTLLNAPLSTPPFGGPVAPPA